MGAGRQRNAPAACSRGGGSPACGVSGVPGLSLAWNLVVDVARGMRNTPMRSEQRIGVRDGVCGGGGVCARRSIAGARCSGACARTGRTCAGLGCTARHPPRRSRVECGGETPSCSVPGSSVATGYGIQCRRTGRSCGRLPRLEFELHGHEELTPSMVSGRARAELTIVAPEIVGRG